jgi:beta-glucosidase
MLKKVRKPLSIQESYAMMIAIKTFLCGGTTMLSGKIGVPMEGLAEFGRLVAAQGAVLLKNEGEALPLKKGEKIAVFGRCQIEYYRSGTGSGGAVNVPYTTNLLDGLRSAEGIEVDEQLVKVYEDFIKDKKFADNIKVVPYVDGLPSLLKNTDLIVTRAGASTMSEILSLNLPAIFIPSQ